MQLFNTERSPFFLFFNLYFVSLTAYVILAFGRPKGRPTGQPKGWPKGQPKGWPKGQPKGRPKDRPIGRHWAGLRLAKASQVRGRRRRPQPRSKKYVFGAKITKKHVFRPWGHQNRIPNVKTINK